MTDLRKLRSKDERSKKPNLFNFENTNSILYEGHKLGLSFGSKANNYYKYYPDEDKNTCDLRDKHIGSEIEFITDSLPRLSKKNDELHDNVYSLFHRKMMREEKTMSNAEKEKVNSEIDNYSLKLNSLLLDGWTNVLPCITYIEDKNDYPELVTKKKLTIQEISRLIETFENIRKRQESLKAEIKSWYTETTKGSDDRSEFDMSIYQLKEKRLREKLKRGPIIRLRLHNGYEIIIDNNGIPKVRKIDDSLNGNKEHTTSKKSPTINVHKLDFKVKAEEDVAFGVRLSDLGREDFEIKKEWKKFASTYKVERIKNRKALNE